MGSYLDLGCSRNAQIPFSHSKGRIRSTFSYPGPFLVLGLLHYPWAMVLLSFLGSLIIGPTLLMGRDVSPWWQFYKDGMPYSPPVMGGLLDRLIMLYLVVAVFTLPVGFYSVLKLLLDG